MAFERTRDILEHARRFHAEMAAYYERLENTARKERVRMLLEYLRRHELALERELANYEATARKSVLELWHKYAPADIPEKLSELNLPSDPSYEEVVDLALRMDETLLELYALAAQREPDPKVREIFSLLHAEGLRERARLLRDAFALD